MTGVGQRPALVLIVDDMLSNRQLLAAQLTSKGYALEQAADGIAALECVSRCEPDLILLDVAMPRMDGLEVCRRIKGDNRLRLIPIVLLTAQNDRATRLAGLAAGADEFLTKPFDEEEVFIRARVLLRERVLNLRLDGAEAVILALARAVEARDLYTVHHAERVGGYAREIGRAAGLPVDELDALYKGGVLHDLGKIKLPDAILLKPDALTEAEWALMRTHSAEGERIAAPLQSTTALLPTIRHHHERFDGAGYPDHLVGLSIPAHARIAALGDSYDAMVSDRPYRLGMSEDEARAQLRAGAGTQWDPAFAETFLTLLDGDHLRFITSSDVPVGA